MKKHLLLLVILTGLCFAFYFTGSSAATNLVQNGSFERVGADGFAYEWKRTSWGIADGFFDYPFPGRTGDAVRVSVNELDVSEPAHGVLIETKYPLSVKSGDRYTYTDFLKGDGTSVSLDVRYTMMNGSFSFRGLAVTTTSSLWKKTTVAITVPLGVVAMSVYRIVDHAGTFIIDDVSLTAPALPQGKGYVTFSFDDGRNQSAAIPILHSYGIKATFFLNPTPIIENWEPGVVLTPLEVATLVKDGHEIANHTLTHPQLIGVNPDLLVQEVAGSKELLEKMTGRSILTFAYPFGVFDAEAYSVVSKYHIGARGVSDKTLNLRTSDRYNLNAYTPLPGAPLSKTKAQIDQAVKSGQWLVLVFHSIGPLDTMGAYSNLPKDLSALISYAKQKTQIITVREGLSRFVK